MIKLKPCPFCGGNDLDVYTQDSSAHTWIQCEECNAKGPAEIQNNLQAGEAWNFRAEGTRE